MGFHALILAQHARAHTAKVGTPDVSNQDLVLRGMTDEQLRVHPQPGFNSLAWLFWHITRTEDIGVAVVVTGRTQVIDERGWAARLNVSRRDVGVGMMTAKVEPVDGAAKEAVA